MPVLADARLVGDGENLALLDRGADCLPFLLAIERLAIELRD